LSRINQTDQCLPRILNELVNDRGCYIRIVGRLHPDTDPYTVLVHAKVLDQISRHHDTSEKPQYGWLYGCVDPSEHIVEINGSSLARVIKGELIVPNTSETESLLGMWVIQEVQDASTPQSEEGLPGAGGLLILKVPSKPNRLYQTDIPYGVFIREKEGCPYKGPMGFIIIEKKIRSSSTESGYSENTAVPRRPFDREQPSHAKTGYEAEPPGTVISSKIKVKRPDVTPSDSRRDSEPHDQPVEAAEPTKIKIDKEIIRRYEGLSFLKNRHYFTPRDYTYIIPGTQDTPPKCDQSLFIEKRTLVNIVTRSHDLIRDDIYRYTLLEGRQTNAADQRHIYYVNAVYNRASTPHEMERPNRYHYYRGNWANFDQRSKFKLRVWCVYLKHKLLYSLDHMTVFRYLLQFLETSCTQVGLIISTDHVKLPNRNFFDSGAFRMTAFINAIGSSTLEHFSDSQFHLIDEMRR
jgi:hypothetical protein